MPGQIGGIKCGGILKTEPVLLLKHGNVEVE